MADALPPDATELPDVPSADIKPRPVDQATVDEYINKRVEQYASWYDSKSSPVKRRYLYTKAVSVIGGALVPVLVNIPSDYAKLAATVVSLTVVILVSWDSVFQYGKQWKNYRSTEQFLRQETVLFKHKIGFYSEMDDARAFMIFVQRVENTIAQENAVTLDTLTRESHAGKSASKGS